MRTLILYVFHQECHNLDIFIQRGLFDAPDKEFIFIYNHPQYGTEELHLERWGPILGRYSNVHLFVRPNLGQDFQGWNDTLFLPTNTLVQKIIHPPTPPSPSQNEITLQNNSDSLQNDENNSDSLQNDENNSDSLQNDENNSDPSSLGEVGVYLYQCFDKFIFINSTVAGPYLPVYVSGNWADAFTSKLSETVGIVGISVNFVSIGAQSTAPNISQQLISQMYGIKTHDLSHMQSMAFGLHRSSLETLIHAQLFSPSQIYPVNKHVVIMIGEIAMSVILRQAGYSMFSYLISQGEISPTRQDPTDNLWNDPHPYPLCELMFIKTVPHISFPERIRYEDHPPTSTHPTNT